MPWKYDPEIGLFFSPGGAVTSVFGRSGDVVSAINDYTWAQIDKTISSMADIATRAFTATGSIGLYNGVDALLSGNYPIQATSGVANGATAIGYLFDTTNNLTNASAKVFTIRTATNKVLEISKTAASTKLSAGGTSGGAFIFDVGFASSYFLFTATGSPSFGIKPALSAFITGTTGVGAQFNFLAGSGTDQGFTFETEGYDLINNFRPSIDDSSYVYEIGGQNYPFYNMYLDTAGSLFLGRSSSQSSLSNNGTDLVINPKVIGTGKVSVLGTLDAVSLTVGGVPVGSGSETTVYLGLQGNDGEDGLQGFPGTQGIAGTNGSQGIQGIPGLMGFPGQDGEDGIDGIPGPTGATGPQGAPGGGGNTLYAPGSTTVATGNFMVQVRHLILTGAQRLTLQGTARCSIIN